MFIVFLLCFLFSFFISIFAVPFSNWLAKKFNIYDKPSKRKVSFRKITRWGGFGIMLSFFLTIILILKFFPQLEQILRYKYSLPFGDVEEVIVLSKQLWGIFFASFLVLIVGTIDDKFGINSLTKFLLQIIIAYCAMDFGVRIIGVSLPMSGKFVSLPNILSQVITILWLCGFMNIVNLADGVDGLAGGVVLIASFTFFIVSLLQRQSQLMQQQMLLSSILSITLSGAVSGFLIYNFFPAKLLMGDTGALFLGFIIGCITTMGVLKSGAVIAFVVPLLVIGLPLTDVILSIIRRLKKGISIGTADKKHIHHLLLANGWTEREVVLFFYVVTLFISMFVVGFVALKVR